MQFSREIQRLLGGFVLFMGIISLTATYWAAIAPERLLTRNDNQRLFEARAAIQRGTIVDRHGTVLVETFRDDENNTIREYLHPSMHSALGYYSLRYGVGGVEAAFDNRLSGDVLERTLNTQIEQDLLHIPQQGIDIQLTLDLTIQQQLVEAMGTHRGAAVMLSVPRGEILSMVSLPTYDPNTLDLEWDNLAASPGNPFFNRVLQANYQPGGIIYSLLSAAAIIERHPLTTEYPNAAMPVKAGNVSVSCIQPPPADAITLTEAYLYGCPAPFASLVETLGIETVEATFDHFRVREPLNLTDFVTPTLEVEATPEATPPVEPGIFELEAALGQGSMTVSPLQMAAITAALINAGNAPVPYTLIAERLPGEEAWQPVQVTHPALPMTTLETSQALQALMRQNVQSGTAQNAFHENLEIGGQAALAFTGKETLAWFIGYVRLDFRHGAAVAIVLENSSDLDLVAEIGGIALKAAAQALAGES